MDWYLSKSAYRSHSECHHSQTRISTNGLCSLLWWTDVQYAFGIGTDLRVGSRQRSKLSYIDEIERYGARLFGFPCLFIMHVYYLPEHHRRYSQKIVRIPFVLHLLCFPAHSVTQRISCNSSAWYRSSTGHRPGGE